MCIRDRVERVEAEVANYNQVILNHSISPLDNPAQILSLIHISLKVCNGVLPSLYISERAISAPFKRPEI